MVNQNGQNAQFRGEGAINGAGAYNAAWEYEWDEEPREVRERYGPTFSGGRGWSRCDIEEEKVSCAADVRQSTWNSDHMRS